MRSGTIEKADVGEVEWDDNHFKCCELRDFSVDGQMVCSEFVESIFSNLDWYWGLFSASNFIDCRFTDCVFRGCSFPDCRFVDCTFERCQFVKDNLGGDCKFEGTVAYGCVFIDTEGFMA